MNNIEDIIQCVSKNNIEIPMKIQNRINYTLNNKNKRKNKNHIREFITAIISILCTLLGSFAVYAATGGTIDGIPATDWLGIKFSNRYVEYKQPVKDQVAAFGETSVELTSTVCNEGITILEFDVKLSQEDYNNLRLGETAYTEEFDKKMQEDKEYAREKMIKRIQSDKYGKYFSNESDEEINAILDKIEVTEDEIENSQYYEQYLKRIQDDDNAVEERKNTGFKIGLALNTNQKGGTYNYDKFNPNMDWYATIYIDDVPYYVTNMQKIEKVNDYEYKVYTMYSITDDVLNGKEDFKITLKNNKLVNMVAWNGIKDMWMGHCQWFAEDNESEEFGTPHTTIIDLPGEFEVNVSKNDILKDSKIIENPDIKSEFRNITQTVEKVVVSPIQTIVKVNHSATQQSSNVFLNRYDDPNIEHLPLAREYKVYDSNGKELSCFSITNKNTLIYSNGTREDYDPHDIPNKKYSNATWENVYYLLIENTDADYIKIVPIETIRNPVNGEEDNAGEIYYEMDPLIINLK